MMTFGQILKLPAIGSGLVPDGYHGHMAEVVWRFDPDSGKILRQWSKGYHTDPLPQAADEREARWLLENHLNARDYIVRPYGVRTAA